MAHPEDHVSDIRLRLRGYRRRVVPTRLGNVSVLERAGRGSLPPAVVLHGLGSAAPHYAPLLLRLQRDVRHVTAPDFPAHGFSDAPPRLDVPTLTDGFFEALDALIDEPVVLIGNSMGGYVAARYATQNPDRIRALVLISPGGAPVSDAEMEELRKTFRLDSHDDALGFIDKLFAERAKLRHAYAWGIRRRLRNEDLRYLLDSIEPEHSLSPDDVGALSVPTLLIWGAGDDLLPRRHFEEFWRVHLPDHARVLTPTGFGHSPYMERPDELHQHIREFLRDSFG